MTLIDGVEPADYEPEASIDVLEGRPGPGAEELVAQEQGLDDQPVLPAKEGGQSREEDSEEFKHPGRVADRAGCSFALLRVPCEGLDQQRMKDPPG